MDERLWIDRPLPEGDSLQIGGVSITLNAAPETTYLVSGRISAAINALNADTPLLGLLDDHSGVQNFAICISRDSALLVLGEALRQTTGWHEAGYAMSQASDLYAVFTIEGNEAEFVLAQVGVGERCSRSLSAAIQVTGITMLLVRCADAYQLWVPQAYATYMTSFFAGVVVPENQN